MHPESVHQAPALRQEAEPACEDRALPVAAWLLEFGAVSLPIGHDSRITAVQAFSTREELSEAWSQCEFDSIGGPVVWAADARRAIAAKQAEIDRLMLEHCPGEMTPEQVAEWGRHQQTYHLSDAEQQALNRALKRSVRFLDSEP